MTYCGLYQPEPRWPFSMHWVSVWPLPAAGATFKSKPSFDGFIRFVPGAPSVLWRDRRDASSPKRRRRTQPAHPANGIIAAFNCILFPLEFPSRPQAAYASTLLLLPLPTPSAGGTPSSGPIRTRVDLFRRHIFLDRTRKRGAQEGQHVVYRHRLLFDLACVIPYDWLAHGSAAWLLVARPPRASRPRAPALQAPARVYQLLPPALGMRRAVAQAARLCLYVASLLHWFACLNFGVAYQAITDELDLLEEYAEGERDRDHRLGVWSTAGLAAIRASRYLRSLYRALALSSCERVELQFLTWRSPRRSLAPLSAPPSSRPGRLSQVVDIVTTIG